MEKNKEEIKDGVEIIEEIETEEKFVDNILETDEGIENNLEALTEEKKNEEIVRKGFGFNLLASLLDQAIIVGTSALILLVISFVINMFGYRFVLIGNYTTFIVVYIIVNIFYNPIMMASKYKNTLGKKYFKL